MKFKIRGHHLEILASNLKWDRKSHLISTMQTNPQADVTLIDTYDDFCNRSCKVGCNEEKENLSNWDKAFIILNGFDLNRTYSAQEFLKKMKEQASIRSSFATSDVVMECGQDMSYSEIKEYLSKIYF